MYSNTFTLFSLLFLLSLLLGNGLGLYSNPVAAQKTNEADVNDDIDREKKLNNQLSIASIKQTQTQEKQSETRASETTNLNVKKDLDCFAIRDDGSLYQIPNCQDVDEVDYTTSDFNITVSGNNANPSNFLASSDGTLVTLDPGDFEVTEVLDKDGSFFPIESPEPDECYALDSSLLGFNAGYDAENPLFEVLCTVFSDDCSGTINEGDNLECVIANQIFVEGTSGDDPGDEQNQNENNHNEKGNLNEAEINADIEQENKCKKDTECENENEINNQLSITTITQAQQEQQPETPTCETCFTDNLIESAISFIETTFFEESSSLQEICQFIDENIEGIAFQSSLAFYLYEEVLNNTDATQEDIDNVVDCLEEIFGVDIPRPPFS